MTDIPTTIGTTSIVTSVPVTTSYVASNGLAASVGGTFTTIIPYPTSYQFRVIEWEKVGKPAGVELQVKITQHDQYGSIISEGQWKKVPRIKMELPE
jgi:hypothetical protein